MRELTAIEMNAVGGGLEPESTLQSQFWGSFMASSGFASGIFWSPLMPFIMGSAAIISILSDGIVLIATAVGSGLYTIGSGAVSLVKNQKTD